MTLEKSDSSYKKFFKYIPGTKTGNTVIFAKPENPGLCDPDIYITSKEEIPDSRASSEIYCDSWG